MHLERGHEAYRQRAWTDAYRHLSEAAATEVLAPGDLTCMATAAFLVGEDVASVEALTRAHRAWLDASDVARAARCACILGFMLVETGEGPRAGGWFARAQRLLAEADVDCVEHGYVLLPTGVRQVTGGDPASGLRTFTNAVAIGERFQEPELVGFARHGQGRARIRLGDVDDGLALLDEAIAGVEAGDLSPVFTGIVYCSAVEAAREVSDLRRARAWTAALTAWCADQPDMIPFRGQCLVARAEIMRLQGDWADAMTGVMNACDRLEGPPRRPAAGEAYYQRAELHRLRGEFHEAERAYGGATERGRAPQPGLALLRRAQGRIGAAKAAIERALTELSGTSQRSEILPAYVEIMLAGRDPGRAARAAEELSDVAQELDTPAASARAAYARGTVLLAKGDAEGALSWLRMALSEWGNLMVPYETARARLLLARAFRSLGDDDTANMHVRAARAVLDELGASPRVAVPDLPDDVALLRPNAFGLTPRELEVLRCVAAGETNKGAGALLGISERTVERHVSNIFDKMGVSTRTAATSFAYENDLL